MMFHGAEFCANCLEHYTEECHHCGDLWFSDDLSSVRDNGLFCDRCIDRETNLCGGCDCYVLTDDYDEDTEECGWCLGDSRGRIRRNARVENKELQSKEKGKIITHARRFGIELECLFTKTDTLAKINSVINKAWGITDDGSIRPGKNTIGSLELVSPIMQGKAGEDEIKKLCNTAYSSGLVVNQSCGYHLHLDAPEFKRDKKDDQIVGKKIVYELVDNATGRILDVYHQPPALPSNLRNTTTVRQVEMPAVMFNAGESFQRLRDLWYVYLAFDDVFRAMQPQSRRNNQFCRASSAIYSTEKVRELEDYTELEALWYRIDKRIKKENQQAEAENRKRGKDSTRYTGFNLEPLLRNDSCSIEFRYHSPTLNAEKILRWIDIHQSIVSKIAEQPLDDAYLNERLATETNIVRRAMFMCDFFNLKKATRDYVVERIHKFNEIEVNTEDEEVEPAEIGTPHTRINLPNIRRTPTIGVQIQRRDSPSAATMYDQILVASGFAEPLRDLNGQVIAVGQDEGWINSEDNND